MAFENKYSTADRLLHRIAFVTTSLQLQLSDIEDRIFTRLLAGIELKNPVFITGIPRAGTTLLLEILVKQGEFSSHCYRDMPFVLMPMLWDRFSRPFRKADDLRQRAHGDGVMINVDSPEAFEEIIWKTFWKDHYKDDYILPWQDESDDDFSEFLYQHLKKIIALRDKQEIMSLRYVSKNNLNIARINYLQNIFPDAVIVLPFREPFQHASSLLKQHLNFLDVHENDPFAREYMKAIGHYDFGANLKPVNFNNWMESENLAKPDTLAFWLQYWIAAYQYILEKTGKQIALFNYDAFCRLPEKGLTKLGDYIGIESVADLKKQSTKVRTTRPHEVDTSSVSYETVQEANNLFALLQSKSII